MNICRFTAKVFWAAISILEGLDDGNLRRVSQRFGLAIWSAVFGCCSAKLRFVRSSSRPLRGTLPVFLVRRFTSGHGCLEAKRFDAISLGLRKFLTPDVLFCLRDTF